MIIKYSQLADLRLEHAGEVLAYSGGVFDLVHEGHLKLFSCLREFGQITVVGISPDARVQLRKGPLRPIQSEATRLAVVAAMRDVDFAFVSPLHAPGFAYVGHSVLKSLKPDIFITSDKNWLEDRDWLSAQGTELKIIPRFSEQVSTTATIERIVSLNIDASG